MEKVVIQRSHPWRPLTGKVDAAFFFPPVAMPTSPGMPSSHALDAPLKITLRVRNRAGLSQTVSLPAKSDNQPVALGGFKLSLEFLPAGGGALEALERAVRNSGSWRSISPKQPETRIGAFELKILTPTESVDVMVIVLQDWFEISEPGFYRLRAVFDYFGGSAIRGDLESELFFVD